MRVRAFAVGMAIVAICAGAQSVAQRVPPPVEPFMGRPAPLPALFPAPGPLPALVPAPIPVLRFSDYAQLFAHIAEARGVTGPDSQLIVQQLEARSTIEHLRDYSGEPIVVVKLDLGSPDGNCSFYVLREKSEGLLLLGEMVGRSYESTTERGHLEFALDVNGRDAQVTPPRYQVDGDFLVNLARLERHDPVEADWKYAF